MTPRLAPFCPLLVLLACAEPPPQAPRAAPADAGVVSTADAAPDIPSYDSRAYDSPPPADAAPPADAQPDADPLPGYTRFLSDHRRALEARLAECLGKDPRLLELYRPSPRNDAATSLRLGLVGFDGRAAATCLEELRRASCDRILETFQRHPAFPGAPPCPGVLVGRVADGQSCLSPADCQSRELACTRNGSTCGTRCLAVHKSPPAAIGAPCTTGACVDGAACKYVSLYNSVCVARGEEGSDCPGDQFCAEHLYCARNERARADGRCRRLAAGGACRGTWQCPYGLACVGATMDADGTCQAGKRTGEPCVVQGGSAYTYAYSDCADGDVCVDLDGSGRRCRAGAPLGGRCGNFPQPFQSSNYLPCFEGYCERSTAQEQFCRPRKAAGAPCGTSDECDAGRCVVGPDGNATCKALSAFGVGDACTGRDGDLACPAGTACRPDHNYSYNLTCQPIKKAGDPCEPLDHCEPLSACKDGVCTPC